MSWANMHCSQSRIGFVASWQRQVMLPLQVCCQDRTHPLECVRVISGRSKRTVIAVAAMVQLELHYKYGRSG